MQPDGWRTYYQRVNQRGKRNFHAHVKGQVAASFAIALIVGAIALVARRKAIAEPVHVWAAPNSDGPREFPEHAWCKVRVRSALMHDGEFIARARPDGQDGVQIDSTRGFWWFRHPDERLALGARVRAALLVADFNRVSEQLKFAHAPIDSSENVHWSRPFAFDPGARLAFDLEISEVNDGCTTSRVVIERASGGGDPVLSLVPSDTDM